MASPNLANSPAFLVFPALSREYAWRVIAVETNRTISRHKNLHSAVEKAEQLNRRALMPAPVFAEREDFQAKDERGSCQLWYEFGADRADASPCEGIGSITDTDNGATYCLVCWKVNHA